MASSFANVTLSGDTLDPAALISNVWNSNGGSFYITGGNVFAIAQFPTPGTDIRNSGFANFQWTDEQPLPSGPGTIPKGVCGIQFRNADASTPATVSASISPPGHPVLAVSAPASVSQTSSGMITGIIPATGATPTAGSGFTYTHVNGSGKYVFLFDTAFAAAPTVSVDLVAAGQTANRAVLFAGPAMTGFTVATYSDAGVLTDHAFNFIAVPTV